MVLQWHYPDMANGIIRSFVVNVEETEKHDQNSCCQVYPLVEIPVQEEMPLYQAEVIYILSLISFSKHFSVIIVTI